MNNKKIRRSFLLIPVVSISLTLLFGLHFGFQDTSRLWKSFIHGLIMTTGLWVGCMGIVLFLWNRFPWERYPGKHLVLEIILIVLFTNIFALSYHWLGQKIGLIARDHKTMVLDIVLTNLITFLITTIYECINFYQQWKYNFSKSVRLERDNIEAKYETLKSQINPHFLFNSLNSLTSLVDDNFRAVEYVHNLSDFLRYMLKSNERELVLLKDELQILDKYVNLQKTRFQKNLHIELDIPEKYFHYSVPPLVLQMLIENSIKHNVISTEKPLNILVKADKKRITIKNNLQKKNNVESTGLGLINITERYRFFTNEEVIVQENRHTFKVEIPLLEVDLC